MESTIHALYCDTHYIATSPKTHFKQCPNLYPNPNPNLNPEQYPKPCPNPKTIAYALIKCCRNIVREPESTWIYSRIYPVEMWNKHGSVDFEIFNAILLILVLHYNFTMNYSSP